MAIKVGIIGGAGYTGGELIRLLIHHPEAELIFVQSTSNAGNAIQSVHADLIGETDLQFSGTFHFHIDVLFFCSGHGEAIKFIRENEIPTSVKLIDLGNDFRLDATALQGQRKFVYGLPELNRAAIKSASNIANPGCFATTIQLGVLPLANAGLLQELFTTGITGSTGAGHSFSATSHFSWRANNVQAYKTLTHQHNAEIIQSLQQLQPTFGNDKNAETGLNFVPWRGDFTRGIFASTTLRCNMELPALTDLFSTYYANHPFVELSESAVFLKQVVNTNKCVIQLEKIGNKLVVHSVTDNLLKGASGQAVQNMNLMFGLEEITGLKLKANYF